VRSPSFLDEPAYSADELTLEYASSLGILHTDVVWLS